MEPTLVPAHRDLVKEVWAQLESRARPHYFMTWGWIENWLATLPAAALPSLAIVRDGTEIVGAGFVAHGRSLTRHLWPTRARFLNTTGNLRWDALCIEHNTLLSTRPWTIGELVSLLPSDWDELVVPAVSHDHVHDALPSGFELRVDRAIPAPFVDLRRVRTDGYLPLLSANTRQQVRRARRAVGDFEMDVARTVDDALAYLDELVVLHTQSWRARGKAGAFADPWFVAFHRRLITSRFEHGDIQLLRFRTEAGTFAVLYNLVSYGQVLFYQSGLVIDETPARKNGYVAHAAAIEHSAAANLDEYDFLAGSGQYKQSLATDAKQLAWVRVTRAKPQFAVEDWLRSWKNRWRDATSR